MELMNRDVAALWSSLSSAIALATYVFGGLMLLMVLFFAFADLRLKRSVRKAAALAAREREQLTVDGGEEHAAVAD